MFHLNLVFTALDNCWFWSLKIDYYQHDGHCSFCPINHFSKIGCNMTIHAYAISTLQTLGEVKLYTGPPISCINQTVAHKHICTSTRSHDKGSPFHKGEQKVHSLTKWYMYCSMSFQIPLVDCVLNFWLVYSLACVALLRARWHINFIY